ncbi:hypothetical protein XENOCAPTIV_013241 [Xenoophorus captivus]|uniref:Uncharacterized protein n=1 Tax=Xenoophorus captivus TaxID=1517983 RepID=A0ABV0SGS1_9TELE
MTQFPPSHFLNRCVKMILTFHVVKQECSCQVLLCQLQMFLLDSLWILSPVLPVSLVSLQLAGMNSWVDLRNEIVFLTQNATSSPSALYKAVSRIVCGHPEGGGLQIKSLNWYEDSNYKAMFGNHNSSEDATAVLYDNSSSEPDFPGARCVQGPGWHVGGDETQSLGLHGKQPADGRDQGKQAPPTTIDRHHYHRCAKGGGLRSPDLTCQCLCQCVNLDKLEPVSSEEQLVNRSMLLLEDRKFWAGIVFSDIAPNTTDLPPKVDYKLRMDIDNVERTNKIKDA